MDPNDTFAGSLSTPISPDPEPLETPQLTQHVQETNAQRTDQDVALEPRSWDSDASHKSEDEDDDGWMVTPLATLAARRQRRVSSEDLTQEDEADVERSVRAALRLLEESDEAQESDVEADGGLVDFMHEVMEDRWTLEDRDGPTGGQWRTSALEEEEEEDRLDEVEEDTAEKQETGQEDAVEEQEKGQEDEWQEAYTAKGRVYYYNRRTRESSWKKPSHYNSSKEENQQAAAAATEEQTELHESVVRQSLGYHPSAPASASERQTTLFCSFCGESQPSERLAAHFQDCATVKSHKRRMSQLYLSFERALGLISEDVTLRSLHYATSFPDPSPHGRPDATSMQDSLLLLRPRRRRSSYKELHSTERTPLKQHSSRTEVFDTAVQDSTKSPDRRASRDVDTDAPRRDVDTGTIRRKKKSVTKRKSSQPPTSAFTPGPVIQNMETCPYCSRSFAEGRLAKHEAVCQRVFGNEGSWGRGTPSPQVSSPSLQNARVGTPPSAAVSVASKLHKLKDHTLQQSYKEHQATLVLCPCCRRKFAPSGAQQHIAICKGVQNRPKNSIPLLRDYAIAG